MKKLILFTMASMMAVFTMAAGRNDGSTKANAIEFDWNSGIEHDGGTLWYRVDLAPLYDEDDPSLTLYLTNPSNDVGTSVDVSMQASVAGQTESKDYSIAARQYKTYTANAKMLVTLKQNEIYLTLSSTGKIKLSAKVFEAADLDETCKNARTLSWNTVAVQNPSYSAWWKVSLTPIKNVTAIDGYDAKVTIVNTGSAIVNLKVGQSLDCPSSGLTKRTYTLAPNDSIIDTIPRSMINSVQPDELYFGIENVESQVSIKVERVAQPSTAVIPAPADMPGSGITSEHNLLVTDTMVIPAGKTLYRISVVDMDSLAKYEPEFTYRNEGTDTANMTIKMAFERPAYGTSNTNYVLAPAEEEIVVYKKNMLEGMAETVDSIYFLVITDKPINFYGRFKHVREGKACKTNIDFSWETGHTQEARTTQWYAVNVADARERMKDIMVYAQNLGPEEADVKVSMAFSCPYIDLQEMSRTLKVGDDTVSRRVVYSTYALLSDTVWFGLETNQDVRFWADTVDAQTKDEPDPKCLTAKDFDWEDGVHQNANDTTWYRIDMNAVRESTAKFPTLVIQNLSMTETLTFYSEQSLECPDSIENEVRKIVIEPKGSYESKISRNLFENIVQDELWVRLTGDQEFALQVRLTEEAAGASCMSAVPFNWVSGNTQDANADVWYSVDMREVMINGYDIRLHIKNNDAAPCNGYAQLIFACPSDETPSQQTFKLAQSEEQQITIRNSAFEMLTDSTIYVNLQATTSIRFWVEELPAAPFDTIYSDGLTLTPLYWDSLYTQTTDTAWYIIPKSEIELVRNLAEKVTPVAHVYNLGGEMTVKGEAAFAFPIVKTMMSKNKKLQAGQHVKDTIPVGTFEQFLKKDSVILRITRPAGAADFQFKAELVKAFNGNTRKDARPFVLGTTIEQSANSAIWYRIKTADWKKDKTLFNKSLTGFTKNVGTITADIKVEAYDGILSEVNLLEGRGSIRSPKGEVRKRTVPAQIIYGLGDLDLYVLVKTTDTLIFQTSYTEYAPAPVDPKQKEAKLLVPNVEYVLPGDNEEHWYQVCLPYMQNNYKYTAGASLEYELNGAATIEGTATFQDEMDCAMPVRKRTINKAGGLYKGAKPLRDLIQKALNRANLNVSIEETAPDFVDSMLHRFVTKDSITAYVRLKSDKDIKVRLNMQQIKGTDDDCLNAMVFDWEHGNVNPKNQNTWYVVELDSTRIPANKDIRLRIDNWSDTEVATAMGDLYFKCDESKLGGLSKTINPGDSITKDISRDFLVHSGWPSMLFMNYVSDQTTHLHVELVDPAPRDTLRDTTTVFVCMGKDTLHNIINVDTMWIDTISDLKDSVKAAMYDSISVVYAYVLRDPTLYAIEAIDADSMPVIKRGEVIDVTLAEQWLNKRHLAEKNDTVKAVNSITWQYSTDGVNYVALPTTPIATERINLQYTLNLECDDTLDTLFMNAVRDTLDTTVCNSFLWEDSLYIKSTEPVDSVIYPGGALLGDSIAYLKLQVNNPHNDTIGIVAKFGDRLLMINRNEINTLLADTLDLEKDTGLVSWYMVATPEDKFMGYGYYLCMPNGEVLNPGTYYAEIVIPAKEGEVCGATATTKPYTVGGVAAAPALMPSLARPGEDIRVVNLDPEQSTLIRIYTTEGLLQSSYRVSGQTDFIIKAADAIGFYLVELSNENMKTTLRYIIK